MFGDKQRNLERLEKELLAEEEENLVFSEAEKTDFLEEDFAENSEEEFDEFEDESEEEFEDEAPVYMGKKKLSTLTKLSITALCLLGGILLVMLYWLIRFFL